MDSNTQTLERESPQEVKDSAADRRRADSQQLQLVTFELGEEEFAVDILLVQEINRMLQITHVPQSPPEVEGVINLRGRIIPVIDLRKRFDMAPVQHSVESRIIVVEVARRVIGFVVDRVHEVLRIDSSIVEPAPEIAGSSRTEYIQGVGKLDDRLLILIDLDRLFSERKLENIEQVLTQARA